ncbi:MAG: PD-(D/E)XK nuclease family protein [Methanomassiliicoccaceae archaeon]|nr:PD-(D/E)XK nuclease family protein [Methanomassiliicoccaceae archaeon]
MTTYSHSRLSAFEQCRHRYKLRYIDKVAVPEARSVELFLGDMVHRTLERLYRDLGHMRTDTLEELIDFYRKEWASNYTDEITIVKEHYTQDNYLAMGERYISDYYERFKPFDGERVLGVETQDRLDIGGGRSYHIRMDRLARRGNEYYVCDYKTNSNMMTQKEADADRQLAMYALWVRENFPDAERIVLVWHMLKFDADVRSVRTDAQLDSLLERTVEEIDEIEACTEWPTSPGALCKYCEYRWVCPETAHLFVSSPEGGATRADDDGARLVDELSDLKEAEGRIAARSEALRASLLEFARARGITAVYGSNYKLSVKETRKAVLPEDKAEVIKAINEKGLQGEYLMVNSVRLKGDILKGKADPEIIRLAEIVPDVSMRLSKRRDAGGTGEDD